MSRREAINGRTRAELRTVEQFGTLVENLSATASNSTTSTGGGKPTAGPGG